MIRAHVSEDKNVRSFKSYDRAIRYLKTLDSYTEYRRSNGGYYGTVAVIESYDSGDVIAFMSYDGQLVEL